MDLRVAIEAHKAKLAMYETLPEPLRDQAIIKHHRTAIAHLETLDRRDREYGSEDHTIEPA